MLFDFSQEDICKNYHGIRLKPDHFSSYLTADVGFSSYELIGTPQNYSRGQSFEMPCNSYLLYCAVYVNIYFILFPLGFQRPIYIFHKGPSPQKWQHQFDRQLWLWNPQIWRIWKQPAFWKRVNGTLSIFFEIEMRHSIFWTLKWNLIGAE